MAKAVTRPREREPEHLYHGCSIHTMDESRPQADGVAVLGKDIAAVGSVEECRVALGPGRVETDLGGGTLLPGFVDTHIHPVMLAYFEQSPRLNDARSIADVQDVLSEAARGVAEGAWVLGLDFDDQLLREKRMLTRHELDAAVGTLPAVVLRYDGHMLIASTRAIQAAGVDASTPDPQGGFIDRESGGFPAGPFREAAAQVVLSEVPLPDVRSFLQSARGTFKRLAARGITSIGAILQTEEEGPAGQQGALDIPAMQLLLDGIPQGVFSMLIARDVSNILEARRSALENPAAGHRVGAMKILSDGSLGSCTAFMSEPFVDSPANRGFMIYPEAELYRRMAAAHAEGLQLAIHAIGDEAVRTCLALYDRLLAEDPRPDARHRLEHASVLDERLIEEMARLGVVAAVTPMYIRSEKEWLAGRLGEERARWTYPFRDMLDAGVRLAGSSDAPVESTDVLAAIECCVTRDGFYPGQGLKAEEALRMYTLGAAFAQHEDAVKGSITPGKRADMVLLDADPTAVAPERIGEINVLRTFSGGRTVFP